MPILRTSLLSLLALPVLAGPPAVPLDQGWRFMPGDQPGYAAPALDDSKWTPINIGATWEAQGHKKVAGVAWYRLRFTLPAALRAQDRIKAGLRIALGRIGDCDQTYLNGKLVGTNGQNAGKFQGPDPKFAANTETYLGLPRLYVVKEDDPCLNWGGENVLAVQVLDISGAGGLASPGAFLRLSAQGDVVTLDTGAAFSFGPKGAAKTFSVTNGAADHTLAGTLEITGAGGVSGKPMVARSEALDLAPGAARSFTVEVPAAEETCALTYKVSFKEGDDPVLVHDEAPYVLTPPESPKPRINGPAVVGGRPGHPFLYTIPVSGVRPMVFDARNLPPGLKVDPATGIISGAAKEKGTWKVQLAAKNAKGTAKGAVELVIGDRLALTPPMGWNSWNVWGLTVSEELVVASARTFIDQGLQAHGWNYVNIDDGWEIAGTANEPKRDPQGRILTNRKFPDMARLGRRLHEMGLHFGIYSSPGPLTCGGYTASWQHEQDDARSYAEWGVDYLKYDWCSYDQISKGETREELMKPYLVMRDALARSGRDIVFSLCQYGMGKVWEWGDQVGGNLWRTTDDIQDTWESMAKIGFSQAPGAPYARPGNWNDPDMMVLGWVSWGETKLRNTRLTPDEQYTHVSLWSLLSAPLLIGCDLTRLDAFTRNLLCNDEVIAIDQDPLGSQAVPKVRQGDLQVWVKDLKDGHKAFGVFNLGKAPAAWKLDRAALGIGAEETLRDLWRQKDLAAGATEVMVAPHGVVLLRAHR